jgi:bifunctional ADP-heptose synthase (sugar kinase/adenylyltransferase)
MLKGHDRPINSEMDRAEMIASLQCVGHVFIIDSTDVADAIRMVRPDKWYKGGDYTLQTLNQEEVKAANEVGSDIVIVPATTGYSTTNILSRI